MFDPSTCLLILGPALSGTLVQNIGFGWMLFGIAIINFMYAPLIYFLRRPPTKEERQVSLFNIQTASDLFTNVWLHPQSLLMAEKSTIQYKAYQNMEEEYP